jgi:hypothetical protein
MVVTSIKTLEILKRFFIEISIFTVHTTPLNIHLRLPIRSAHPVSGLYTSKLQ